MLTWRGRRRRRSRRSRHRPPRPPVPRDRGLESARSGGALSREGVRCRPSLRCLPHCEFSGGFVKKVEMVTGDGENSPAVGVLFLPL